MLFLYLQRTCRLININYTMNWLHWSRIQTGQMSRIQIGMARCAKRNRSLTVRDIFLDNHGDIMLWILNEINVENDFAIYIDVCLCLMFFYMWICRSRVIQFLCVYPIPASFTLEEVVFAWGTLLFSHVDIWYKQQ